MPKEIVYALKIINIKHHKRKWLFLFYQNFELRFCKQSVGQSCKKVVTCAKLKRLLGFFKRICKCLCVDIRRCNYDKQNTQKKQNNNQRQKHRFIAHKIVFALVDENAIFRQLPAMNAEAFELLIIKIKICFFGAVERNVLDFHFSIKNIAHINCRLTPNVHIIYDFASKRSVSDRHDLFCEYRNLCISSYQLCTR